MTPTDEHAYKPLRDAVHTSLKQWHRTHVDDSPLANLYLFRELRRDGHTMRGATTRLLLDALQVLEANHGEHAELLRDRFVENVPVHTLARQRNESESTVYNRQRDALDHLTKVLSAMEREARAKHHAALESRLDPPAYNHLVGVETYIEELTRILASAEPPWLVCLEGIGGIGKTALADALMRRLIRTDAVDDLGWVSAQQRRFDLSGTITALDRPALTVEGLIDALLSQLFGDELSAASLSSEDAFTVLQRRLRQQAHVIVIDNLETLVDTDALLPTLRRLVNPTTFLLTSRESLQGEPDVYCFAVPELVEADALDLIRREARLRNVAHLQDTQPEGLRPMYDTIGGNPLALRLIVGLTQFHPLGALLEDLSRARSETAENLYTYIYRRAWENLDEVTRRAFLVMPLVTDHGGDLEYLTKVTAMSAREVRAAVETLVTLNLVDVRGTLEERRYTIHNLTRAFLQEQVAKWA